MKTIQSFSWRFAAPFALVVLGFWLCSVPVRAADVIVPRQRLLMDAGWKFHLGNEWGTGEELQRVGKSRGPAAPDFKDAGWRALDLPHDWAVELPFDRNSDRNHGFKPVGPGYPTNSVGWYRRTFNLPSEDAGKRLWLEFDGAFRDTRVFVNGYFVGHHESGYSSFRYDITDVVNCGGKNVVAVRVDASEFEGWWYEGAGIYRHVWLDKTAPVAIAPDGIFVSSRPPNGCTVVEIQAQIQNTKDVETYEDYNVYVNFEIIDPSGKSVGEFRQHVGQPVGKDAFGKDNLELKAGSQQQVKAYFNFYPPNRPIRMPSPTPDSQTKDVFATTELWSPESPKLYRLITTVEIMAGGALMENGVLDRKETEFGIRTTAWDADKGFLLNGKPYVIQGTCNHQDHAGVGVALLDRLQYFRVARLKEMGCNAYRTSHNPPTPELLEACDRLGMLVMDENRILGSDAMNLDRLEGLVRRDRNHPSVFVWCIGNEEPVQTTPAGGRLAGTMQRLIHRLDPTRLVTEGGNVGNVFQGLNRIIDVRGWNYNFGKGMDDYHAAHAAQPNVATEQSSSVGTRGIYATDKPRGYVSAYDESGFPWPRVTETWWTFVAARPWMSGGFVWTGFDYRGEPSPFNWPCVSSHFGVLDTCGFPKDDFYYYQAWWQDRPMLHLAPHWNWPGKEDQEIAVRCFSNCEEVELFLNGQSLGKQAMRKNSDLRWKVKYAPGTLSARGYRGGQVAVETKVETTGAPAGIKLIPDRQAINADGEDLSIINIAVADAQGRVVLAASNLVRFELSGPGRILGVGNGDPSCHEADVYVSRGTVEIRGELIPADWKRSVFNGLAQIIIQAGKNPGELKLTARSEGLGPATLFVPTRSCASRPAVP